MSNEIKMTFAGDSKDLEGAFGRLGTAATSMDGKVGRLPSTMGSSEDAFEGLGRSANRLGENLDRASGASSMLSGGIGDVGGALTAAFGEDSGIGKFGEQMEVVGTVVMGFTGVMDLAILANTALSAGHLKSAASATVHGIATTAIAIKTGVWTAAQWLLNVALSANPIGLIILGIVALVGVIILIATKTTWFQTAWKVAWGAIKTAAVNVWNWLSGLPGKIGSAFGRVGNLISAPFRSAFNAVARAWNNTVGSLSWTVPGWVPFVGGNSISAPRLPEFHTGGMASGALGGEFLAVLKAGERVTGGNGGSSSGGGVLTVQASGSGTSTDQALAQLIVGAIQRGALNLVVVNGRVASHV